MNKITLKGGYWIKAESIGYSLNQDFKPKRGFKGVKPDPNKTATRTVGYFGNLEGCLTRYLDECVHDEVGKTEIDSILYLQGIILAAKEEIKTKLKDR